MEGIITKKGYIGMLYVSMPLASILALFLSCGLIEEKAHDKNKFIFTPALLVTVVSLMVAVYIPLISYYAILGLPACLVTTCAIGTLKEVSTCLYSKAPSLETMRSVGGSITTTVKSNSLRLYRAITTNNRRDEDSSLLLANGSSGEPARTQTSLSKGCSRRIV